jgi:hypothetical protein
MKIRFFLLPIFIIYFSSNTSCALFWGPQIQKNITIEHISSTFTSNDGIGNDWELPQYTINNFPFDITTIYSIQLSTWDTLTIHCIYTENDDVYSDIGVGSFSLPIWEIIKKYGNDFTYSIQTSVYEQRSQNPSNSGNRALWEDSFKVIISDI